MQLSHQPSLIRRYTTSIDMPRDINRDINKDSNSGGFGNKKAMQVPEDTFTKSDYVKNIESLDIDIKDGFEDAQSFLSMANHLKSKNILNTNDLMAANFLAKASPTMSFDAFNKVLENNRLSDEMRSLTSQLINKLHTINYIHSRLLISA